MFVKQMPITIHERTGETDPSLALRMTRGGGKCGARLPRRPLVLRWLWGATTRRATVPHFDPVILRRSQRIRSLVPLETGETDPSLALRMTRGCAGRRCGRG